MVQLSSLSKQQAHDLIDRMTPAQLSAVVGLLETIIDRRNLTILKAPFSDEAVDDLPGNEILRRSSVTKFSAADERMLSELGSPADDSDFWPRPGQA